MSTLIAYASLVSTPWKNAGGSTAEIAVSPPGAGFDDFDWRLSLATIRAAGPFSVFPGVDRTLALVDGPGLILDIDIDSVIGGGRRRVALGGDEALVAFPGEAAVGASLDGGAATDFNVMTRRARCHHRVGRRSVAGRILMRWVTRPQLRRSVAELETMRSSASTDSDTGRLRSGQL